MMVSTKGRYALRVMIDLAQQGGAGYIPLKDIAQRQGLSEKYLESIVKLLARRRLMMYSRFSSETIRQSPPDSRTSRTSG